MKQVINRISLGSAVQHAPDLATCDLAGETAILHLGTGQYYGLDAVGSRIWELIPTSRHIDSILETLLEEYAVDRRQCENELCDWLSVMLDERLIQVNDAHSA